MKKFFGLLVLCLVLLNSSFFCIAETENSTSENKTSQAVNVGGVSIIFPVPAPEFVEVGYDKREFMEVFVPGSNRLLSAYILTSDLPLFGKNTKESFSKYGLIEVSRGAEYMTCEVSDFNEVISSVGSLKDMSFDKVEKELNDRLKSIGTDEVKIGQPIQLGTLFKKDDVFGLGMLSSVDVGGRTMKMACCTILMRVKKKLIFIYLYDQYKDENSIKTLAKISEKWADEILKVNL